MNDAYLVLWNEVFDRSVTAGNVVAISLLCLLQLVLHACLVIRSRRLADSCRAEIRQLEATLKAAQREKFVKGLESSVLQEFIAQGDSGRAANLILRRCLPNPARGFAVLFRVEHRACAVMQTRGLSKESCNRLRLDAQLICAALEGKGLVLDRFDPASTAFCQALARRDSEKVEQLFILATQNRETETAFVLVSTRLFPAGAETSQQFEIAYHLMTGLAIQQSRTTTLVKHQHELQFSRDMLELRALADAKFDSPQALALAFLTRVLELVDMERAVLLFQVDCSLTALPAVFRDSIKLPSTVVRCWEEHEQRLTATFSVPPECVSLDRAELERAGVETLLSRALLVPLQASSRTRGILCVTSRFPVELSEQQCEFVSWAGKYLCNRVQSAAQQAHTAREARQDALTQLSNRRSFDCSLASAAEAARFRRQSCSLLLCDLDRFKFINDSYGHLAGDEVLRHVARTLEECVRRTREPSEFVVARYGGEEMAVLIPGVGLHGALRLAVSIRTAVAEHPAVYDGHQIAVTISIGVASLPDHGNDQAALVAAADAALYFAKASGRNRVASAAEVAAARPRLGVAEGTKCATVE